MLLGAHVSIKGGVQNAPQNGVNLGCDVIQMFSKNQRQWASKPLSKGELEGFRENYRAAKLRGVVVHDSYLINFGAPDETIWSKSKAAFLDEVRRCDALGIPDLVFHPGSHLGRGVEWGAQRIAEALRETLDATQGASVRLDLELMAGQGTNLGNRVEDLRSILDLVGEEKRVGICVDTCHAFAAGYDIATKPGYEAFWKLVDREIGLRRVRAFHLNDSKKELNCRVDRHENIGQGFIGKAGFRLLMKDERFASIPMNLETPGGEEGYRADLKLLRQLAG